MLTSFFSVSLTLCNTALWWPTNLSGVSAPLDQPPPYSDRPNKLCLLSMNLLYRTGFLREEHCFQPRFHNLHILKSWMFNGLYELEPWDGCSYAPTFRASATLPSSLWSVLRMCVSVCGQLARSRDVEAAGKKRQAPPGAPWCASTVGDETLNPLFHQLNKHLFLPDSGGKPKS